jgi:hypothetical protein
MTDKEIVTSLRRCQFGAPCARCSAVSYKNCMDEMHKCAADLIERMIVDVADLRKEIERKDMVIALAQRKQAEAEAERDAAIADLKISSGCASCKYHCSDPIFCRDCNKKQNCKCMSCSLGLTNWKWHGLPEAPEEGEKA